LQLTGKTSLKINFSSSLLL